ncbi:MAG: hypothetical protein QM796_20685 [Chthoniobacteraceae bacterium]
MSEFIPNIDTANEEIERLEKRVAELEAQVAASKKPLPVAVATTQRSTQTQTERPLFGLQRAIDATQRQQKGAVA